MSIKGMFWRLFFIVALVTSGLDIFTNLVNPIVGDIGLGMLFVLVIRMLYILYIMKKDEGQKLTE